MNALLHFALAGIKFGLKPISIKDKDRVQSCRLFFLILCVIIIVVESMPEDVVKGLREMVEDTETTKATEAAEGTTKEQVVEKEWGTRCNMVI